MNEYERAQQLRVQAGLCPKCGSTMRTVMGAIGIPFQQCSQYENHKEPAPQ